MKLLLFSLLLLVTQPHYKVIQRTGYDVFTQKVCVFTQVLALPAEYAIQTWRDPVDTATAKSIAKRKKQAEDYIKHLEALQVRGDSLIRK